MKTYSVVALSPREAATVARVISSLGVGFPEAAYDRSHADSPLIRALHQCATKNNPLTHATLLLAETALAYHAAVTKKESNADYWRVYLTVSEHPNVAPQKTLTGPGGYKGLPLSYGLVTDPETSFKYLAECRALQYLETCEALAVVRAALALATPVVEVADDEEGEW